MEKKKIYLTAEIVWEIFDRCVYLSITNRQISVVRSACNASKNPRILSPAGLSPYVARAFALFSHSDALYHADLLFVENLLYAVRPENAYERTRARAITIYRRSFLFGRPCTRGQRENLPRDKFRKSIRFAKHSTAVRRRCSGTHGERTWSGAN